MTKSEHRQVLAEAAKTTDRSLSSDAYLAGVRERSCYTVLRASHGFLTGLAIFGCAILLVSRVYLAETGSDALFASLICGAVIVGVLIERRLFTAIVDAVDVLVDIGRRRSDSK